MHGGLTLVSGGTENHLCLIDATSVGTTGKIAEEALDRCGITVNKNMIPFDQRKPLDPSGIRVGTPALTTRGMGSDQMRDIGNWIVRVMKSPDDAAVQAEIRQQIEDLCQHFPVPAAATPV
jgi:glycine hydroxymethyltransferase